MAEFYLYADESGKFHKSDIISFCGYLSHVREWERLAVEWNGCRLAWDVPPIHMADIQYPERDKSGQWATVKEKWGALWEQRREAMLAEFARFILQSHAVCMGCAVDAEYFRSMPDSKFKKNMGDPLYLAFYTVIMNTVEAIDRLTDERSLTIVVDNDPEYSMSCYKVLNDLKMKLADKLGKKIDAICFADDKAYPGIQAADMISYETRSFLIQKKIQSDAEPSPLYTALTRKGTHQPKIYTPYFLDRLEEVNR